MHALRWNETTGYFPRVEDAALFGDPVFFSNRNGNALTAQAVSGSGSFRDFNGGQGADPSLAEHPR